VPIDRDLLTTVQYVRRRLAEVGPEHIRANGDFERVSLPSQDCDALRDLLVAENAQVVIEIGLAYGSSALAIGEALISQGQQGTKHVIIDAYQHLCHNAGCEAIASAGLSDRCDGTHRTPRLGDARPRRIRRSRDSCGEGCTAVTPRQNGQRRPGLVGIRLLLGRYGGVGSEHSFGSKEPHDD
jgi:hypothetical protein